MSLLTGQERKTLSLICETFCPEIDTDADNDQLPLETCFLTHSCNIQKTVDHIERRLTSASASEQRSFRRLLRWIEQPLIGKPITGFARPFSKLEFSQRENALRVWCNHKLPQIRQFFQSIKRISLFLAYADSDSPGLEAVRKQIHYAADNPIAAPSQTPKLECHAPDPSMRVSCDFLVIGSGAGGSVAAEQLAASGHDVIVVEKGRLMADAELGTSELEGNRKLFEKTGALATRDLSMIILAGSTVGGGTTVNWMTSLDPPDDVLRQWSVEFGFPAYGDSGFSDSLRSVKHRLNVNPDESRCNRQNEILRDGCKELGYHWRTLPRNVDGCSQCDFCGYGCRQGAKQDTRRTYLKDAIKHGARLIPQAEVRRLHIESGRITHATIVVNQESGLQEMEIQCKSVVLAAGSIHSPALLKRSGVQNRNIGRHLFLHPTSAVIGFHPEPVEAWRGAPQTILCDELDNISNDGYGVRLETAPLHPGFAGMALAWTSAGQHKRLMQRLRYLANTIVICRDSKPGSVSIDHQGNPIVKYQLRAPDAGRLMAGLVAALRIQRSAGAKHIIGPHQTLREWKADESDFETFLRSVEKTGTSKNRLSLYSAHQMSTCRIAHNPTLGAFDPEGRSFDVKNLFIADASAFPTSCGVNPMITIMTIAHYLSQFWK